MCRLGTERLQFLKRLTCVLTFLVLTNLSLVFYPRKAGNKQGNYCDTSQPC